MILAFNKKFVPKILDGSKIHTIREDKTFRWKAGNTIQFATGVRTPNYQCFKESECISTQRVFMTYVYGNIIEISINGREIHDIGEKVEFARNDGFESWDEFFNWFYPLIKKNPDQEFSGKIIHWTEKRY